MSDSQAVKPIETIYKGYRFRSRLEARWAVFFDAIGVEWEYEPEGYDLDGVKYLPDFKLHNVAVRNYEEKQGMDIFCEVKGNMTWEDAEKVKRLFNSGFRVLVLGNIPKGDDMFDIAVDETDQREKYEDTGAPPFGFDTLDEDCYTAIPCRTRGGQFGVVGPDWMHDIGRDSCDDERTLKAYAAARQARFEHGETPESPGPKKRIRDGIETESIEIVSANVLEVEAGAWYSGSGNDGAGVYFRIKDGCSTQWNLGDGGEIEVKMTGQTEYFTIIRALRWIADKLEEGQTNCITRLEATQ